MRNFLRRADNTFKAKSADDLARVTEKLDAARQVLSEAEGELRLKSLEAALADDPEAVIGPVRERLARARDQVQLLEDALSVAQGAERDRLNAAADTAERARVKTIKTHVASLAKFGAEMRHGLEQVIAAWADMQPVVGKYQALLRPEEAKAQFGHTDLRSVLGTLVAAEMFRLAPDADGLPLGPKAEWKLGLPSLKRHGQSWGEIEPLEGQLTRRFSIDAARFAPPSLAPAPVVAAAPLPTIDGAYENDPHIAEMRCVQRLAAGEAPAPVADIEDVSDVQARLAEEAAAAASIPETKPEAITNDAAEATEATAPVEE